MREIIVAESESGGRLDKYLLRLMPLAGKPFIYKMLRKKNIKLNGARASGNELLKREDILALYLSEETINKFSVKAKKPLVTGRLNIVYEDGDLLILNKPAGLLSQPSEGYGKNADSLIGRVCSYLGSEFSPALANRLDRNTSGLVMCGKNLLTIRRLNEAVFNMKVKKFYLAVVYGEVNTPGTLKNMYIKNGELNKGYLSNECGKEIITNYKPLSVNNGYSLLEIELGTGKSHQIRLHLQSAGYPVLGDSKYGNLKANAEFNNMHGIRLNGQLLHAYKLAFDIDGNLGMLNGRELTAKPQAAFIKTTDVLFNNFNTEFLYGKELL